MPKVKDIKPLIGNIAKSIMDINGVKSVFVWGSFAENINKPSFIIRDLDIIAKNNFLSEDLISIIDDKNSPLKIASVEQLKEEGFDPNAVDFTRRFLDIKNYNIDHWAISKDNKLLHWGAIIDEDWDEVKKEAEKYASFIIGTKRNKLNKKSQNSKNRWSMMYDHYTNKYLNNSPQGWYLSELKISEISQKIIKIL
jgi:hypothetical protein